MFHNIICINDGKWFGKKQKVETLIFSHPVMCSPEKISEETNKQQHQNKHMYKHAQYITNNFKRKIILHVC